MTRQARRWTAQEASRAAIGADRYLTKGAPVELLKAQRSEERERLASALLQQLSYVNLAYLFVREYSFHPDRKWRLDLYCDNHRLGVELHGGVFSGGRHTRGRGFTEDREKMNSAVEAGIRVLEYTPKEIADGSALAQIERIINKGR